MDEIKEILYSTLATTKKSSTTDWSKLIAEPNIFDYKSQDEEIKAFREWS